MTSSTKIGIVGLGAMGLGMACCMLKSGYKVSGYDINESALKKFASLGGVPRESPRSAAEEVGVFICVVSNSQQAVEAILNKGTGAVWNLSRSSVIVSCITAAPTFASELRQQIDMAGRSDIQILDCPMSGGEKRAERGDLSLLCCGDEDCIAQTRPLLEVLGSKIHIIPGGLGAGSTMKIAHQILVGVHIAAAVEAYVLTVSANLSTRETYDHIMQSDGASWLYGQRVSHIMDSESVPASSLAIITKDMAMISAISGTTELALPLSILVEQIFKFACIAEQNHNDDTKVVNLYHDNRDKNTKLGCRENPPDNSITETDVENTLAGIHAAASLEALVLGSKLGIDLDIMEDVVKDAAGASKMFSLICGKLKSPYEGTQEAVLYVDTIRRNLASAIQRTSILNVPMPVASMALQSLLIQRSTRTVESLRA